MSERPGPHPTTPAGRPRRSTLLAACCSLSILTASTVRPAPAAAQTAGADSGTAAPAPPHVRRVPRRYLFAAIGAGLGVAVSQLYKQGTSSPGTCTSATCVTFVSTAAGAFIGFLIGRESDELHALRYRTGSPVAPPTTSATMTAEPLTLAVRDSVVAVSGDAGVQLFAASRAALRPTVRRAAGIRNIAGVALLPDGLAVAAASGLYRFPSARGPGALLRDGEASAVAATDDRVFVASGRRVEVLPATADSARRWPGLDLGHMVRALAWDAAHSTLWAAADSTLVALRPEGDSLLRIGAVPLHAPARRVAVAGTRVAVALGDGGVRLFDAADPAAPVERARWTGARFAYDVALSPTRLFVAAGGDGLFVLDATGGPRLVLGLARDLGFAIAVTTSGADAFVLDREGRALRRIPTTF